MKAKIFVWITCMALLFYAAGCKKRTDVGDGLLPETGINAEVETRPHDLVAITRNVNESIQGYYVALPSLYQQTTKRYPAILFFPGGGQAGNGSTDLPLLALDGMMQLVSQQKFPPNVVSGGRNNSFIVLNPQFIRQPSGADLISIFEHLKNNYRVDSTRIYLAGLSNGGLPASELAALIPRKVAALVTMAGVFYDEAMPVKCSTLVAARMPVWSFHNNEDFLIPAAHTINFVNALKSFRPAIAPRLSLFSSTLHDAWTPAIDPAYREDNMNIYEFMLKYRR